MPPLYSENQHYHDQAIHYAGEALLLKCDATVHVEAFDDAVFWEKIFTRFVPGKKLNYIWASNSPAGKETSGCVQCLKYKDYLGKRFFICIDSDYRHLLQEADISTSNYIFQTYTYSIENHLCFASKLNTIPHYCTGIVNNIFDFEAFLLCYSQAVYDTFIWHLYFLNKGDYQTFSKEAFNSILSLNGIPDFNISNNGESIIKELQTRCNAKVKQISMVHPHTDISDEKAHYETMGLSLNSAYLFVRGHNLFDLIVKIGNEVNNQLLRAEANRLNDPTLIRKLYSKHTPFQRELERVIEFEGYKEIENIGKDVINRLSL